MRIRQLIIPALVATLAAAVLGATPAAAEADVVLLTEYTYELQDDLEALRHSTRYGHTFPRDADGSVPQYYGNYTGCYDGVVGRSVYNTNPVRWRIYYDTCEMNRLGAGPNDWDRLRAHERAHTRGWGHWEDPRQYNPAYYPRVRICGC